MGDSRCQEFNTELLLIGAGYLKEVSDSSECTLMLYDFCRVEMD
jgi:hypothetical protein